jgi:5-methylcytosine-specific restriction enzyme A
MRHCRQPNCGEIVARGYCPRHARLEDQARGTAAQRGYGRRWARRAARFRAAFPLCGQRPGGLAPVMSACADEGRVTVAEAVDHVRPHRGDAGLFWDETGNWQSLCAACHARKTAAGL